MWQEAKDKKKWDDLVSRQKHAHFLQSWQWGEFQRVLGRKVLRLAWNNEVFVQSIKMNLPRGFAYWYIPRGQVDDSAFNELQKMLGQAGTLFLRVDPLVELKLADLPFKEVPATQPQCTLLLDLSLSAEQLLLGMRPKTRYNVNLAEKKGLTVKLGVIDNFLRLNKQTTSRDRFISHPDEYYRQLVEVLGGVAVKVWQAEFNGKVLASAIVIYFGDTATYLHGASANEDRNLMAPYLLHWRIIQDAQKRGFKYYDWWGVNPLEENHPAYKKSWEGITRFKAGFSGEVMCYPDSFDLIYRPWWYRVYRLSKSLKSLLV